MSRHRNIQFWYLFAMVYSRGQLLWHGRHLKNTELFQCTRPTSSSIKKLIDWLIELIIGLLKIQDGGCQTGSSYSSGPVADRISIPEANRMFSRLLSLKRTTATDTTDNGYKYENYARKLLPVWQPPSWIFRYKIMPVRYKIASVQRGIV